MADIDGDIITSESEEERCRDVHPRFVREIFGHGDIMKMLYSHWSNDTLPNAYIFSGMRGIGKASVAYYFAKFILTQGSGGDVLGQESLFGGDDIVDGEQSFSSFSFDAESPAVKRIEAGSHADMLVIEPAFDERRDRYKEEITIERTRVLGEFLSLTSAESPYKVVIIDSADIMNVKSANSILKCLEEPPSHTLFILIAHTIGRVLPTIRSRCRVVGFTSPNYDEFVKILALQRVSVEDELLRRLYILSSGSAGIAMELFLAGGLDWYDALLDILLAGESDTLLRYELAESLSKGGISWANMSRMILFLLSRIVKYSVGVLDGDLQLVSEKEATLLRQISSKYSFDYLQDMWQQVGAILHDTGSLNLDKMQVILSIASRFYR